MKFLECVEWFVEDRRLRGCNDGVLATYSQHCRLFFAWLESVGVFDVDQLETSTIEKYLDSLRTREQLRRKGKLSPITIHKRMKHIKTFVMWLARKGLVSREIVYTFPMPKSRRRLPKALRPEQVKALLSVPMCERDKAVLCLFLDSGLRLSELSGLVLDDLEFERGQVHVRHGKGDKERWSLFGSMTAEKLKAWLAVRESNIDSVFVDKWGIALKSGGIYKLVRRIGKSVGLIVHPHQLRHTFATESLDAGLSITDVQLLMGHEHLSTTMIYAYVALGRVRERFQGVSPINRLLPSGK